MLALTNQTIEAILKGEHETFDMIDDKLLDSFKNKERHDLIIQRKKDMIYFQGIYEKEIPSNLILTSKTFIEIAWQK
jgi:hypothetical protein